MKNKIILVAIMIISLLSSFYGRLSTRGIEIKGFNFIEDIKIFFILMCTWCVYEFILFVQKKGNLNDR